MKKKTCRHYCRACRLSFEDTKRYEIHLSSRRHIVEVNLSSDNSRETFLVRDENLDEETILCADEDEYFVNEYFACNESEGERNPTELNQLGDEDRQEMFSSRNERQENFSDDFNESENCDEFGEENDSDDDSATNFYPFPSKIFFLLYCYVHNICRPKVRILYCFWTLE